MKSPQRPFRTSLGRQCLMALTGVGLLVFAVAHLVGTLQFFLGAETLNTYAHLLHQTPVLLWGSRLGLLALAGVHVWTAVSLTLTNRAARPVAYEAAKRVGASAASRTMIWTGGMVAVFIVYHVFHWGVKLPEVHPTGEDFRAFEYTLSSGTVCRDTHRMMVAGFSQPLVSAFYVLGIALLCTHLSHGVRAACQSLGLKTGAWAGAIDRLATVLVLLLFLGYISTPFAVLLGFGRGEVP